MGTLQKLLISLIMLVLPMPVLADGSDASLFTPSHGQKVVRTTTDVILVALPATAIATTLILKDWEGLKEGALSAAATVGATFILKYAVKEDRPDFSNHHSFPSGHSSFTFAAATYIGRRYGWKYAIPAYALSTYTAWGRVYGKKHHWWDVVAGAAIGTASSLIFTHPYLKKHDFAIVPVATDTETGLACSFTF
ncbi:MAG: phosphatase PAP2 family protein [Muribaculum sp.]|nr:phosphatase PAP2 family protein [Muribaculum sp.]